MGGGEVAVGGKMNKGWVEGGVCSHGSGRVEVLVERLGWTGVCCRPEGGPVEVSEEVDGRGVVLVGRW